MTQFNPALYMLQTQSSQPTNPLINTPGQHLIYIGLGGLAITLVLIVGILNRRVAAAIVGSLVLAAVIIFLLMVA